MNLKALIWIFAAYSFALFKYIQVQEKKKLKWFAYVSLEGKRYKALKGEGHGWMEWGCGGGGGGSVSFCFPK